MVKKLLLCASTLVGMYSADVCAQNLNRIEEPVKTAAPAIAKAHLDLNANEVWWGYFNGEYKSNDPEKLLKSGWGDALTYAAGIKIFAQNDYDMGKGKTIEGIKFVVPDLKNIEDVKIWISTTLSEKLDMSDCDVCVQSIDKANLVQALNSTPDNFTNEIRFNTPYTIGDKDVYVGYTFRVTKVDDTFDECPLVIENRSENILSTKGALYKRYDSDPEWENYTTSGILAMQVLLSSEDMKSNAVNITENFTDVAMNKNSTATQPLLLTSIGKNGLKSFKYVVTSNDKVTDEKTVTLDEPIDMVGGKYTYEFPIKSADKHGVYNTNIKITEVNGVANEGRYMESNGEAIVVDNAPTRKVFIEDYTGTWGKGAPFGFINKIKLNELYGDQVLVVSSHNGAKDPMYIKEYDSYSYKIGIKSIPSTVIDRTYFNIYPYLGSNMGKYLRYGYADDVALALTQVSVASVDVDGKVSEDGNSVDVEAKVKFAFDGEKDNYALFYLLTEDGMHNDSWVQTNGMGQYKGKGYESVEPMFEEYINGKAELTGLVYDDVVVAIMGLKTGVEKSISPSIKLGETQTNKQTFDLTENKIIQDKTKLNAVAVLLDTKSGKVVNANKCKVVCGGETAIRNNDADGNAVEAERYTIDGRKVQNSVKGINIIRYSNGKVVKSIVR